MWQVQDIGKVSSVWQARRFLHIAKTQADQNWRRFWRSFFAADAELRGFFKGWTVACCEIVVIFDLGHDDQFRVASGASDSFLWQAQ